MKKLLPLLILLIAYDASAQNYTRDAGIRVGDFFSATYRHYQENDQALEGMLYFGRRGMTFTVLKEYFQPFGSEMPDNLWFGYGFGAHAGYRHISRYRVFNRVYELDGSQFTPLVGIDGYIAAEYRFPNFPLLVGLDFKPYFEYNVIQVFSIYLQSIGLSIKYKF